MPKCGYCKQDAYSLWGTPEHVDICFACIRRQWDELHAKVAADPWTDTKEQRLVLLEATVKILHRDLARLMAALEELG